MKTTHTPGPWAANISELEASSSLVSVRTENGGYLICSDAGYQNAPLIAAAPELLAAVNDRGGAAWVRQVLSEKLEEEKMWTLTPVTTPAELGDAANEADMAAWNEMVAEHPRRGEEITEAEALALLDQLGA